MFGSVNVFPYVIGICPQKSNNNISLSPNVDSQLMQQCIKLITNFLVYYCTSVDIKNLGFKDNNNDPSFKD